MRHAPIGRSAAAWLLSHFGPIALLCATATPGFAASSPSLTVQISSEIAPAGGWAQIKIMLPAPQLITLGELVVTLDPAVFGTTAAVATFSAAGDAWGSANIAAKQVDLQFTSPSGGIGRLPGLPVLTLTVPILSSATSGMVSAITADASKSAWKDGSGNQYSVTVVPGSVTIGGSLSVEDLSPGGGALPGGTVVRIDGTGFTQSTSVEIDEVVVSSTQYVSAQEIDVTLGGQAELTGKRVLLKNADAAQVRYFSAMPSSLDQGLAGDSTHYMLSLRTFASAAHGFDVNGGGKEIVLQNQNLTPVTVYFQAEGIGSYSESPAVTIPAGAMLVYPGGADVVGIVATASQPIRMLGPTFSEPLEPVLPVSVWAMGLEQPMPIPLSAAPGSISFAWQLGTAALAPVIFHLLSIDFTTPFTLVVTGAPFVVTPSQGIVSGDTIPENISVSVNTAGLSVGTYSGSISVMTPTQSSPAVIIPISLSVSASDLVVVSPTQLTEGFSAVLYPPRQPVTINVTSNGNPVAFTASSSVPWMTVSPASGVTPGAILAAFSITGLALGNYNGQIVISGPSNTVTIPVLMNVSSDYPQLQIGAASISFSAQTAGAPPPSQTLETGAQPLTVSVATSSGGNWLNAVPNGFDAVVSVNTAGLKAGTYSGTVTVSAPMAINAQWPVTLVMYDTPPPLTVTPASLMFSGPADGIPPQTLTVQSGGVPLSLTWNLPPALVYALSVPSQTPATARFLPGTASPGFYQGNIAITGGGQTVNVPVTSIITAPTDDPPYLGSIVNAASQHQGAISPGEIVTIYGHSTGPQETEGFAVDSSGKVVTSLEGATVLFDGKPAPLIYGSASQLNVMAPYEIAGETATTISLNYGGAVSTAWTVPVAPSAPGIFTIAGDGVGPAAVLNQDNSVNSASNPAARGTAVQVYATGEGQTSPLGVTGSVTQSNTKTPLLPVIVTIGGVDAAVQYEGSAPDSVAGLLQVNAMVPQGISPGSAVPIVVSVGGVPSQAGVTIAVK